METRDYVIRGGIEGRERFRLLSRVLRPTTLHFPHEIGSGPRRRGCSGGHRFRGHFSFPEDPALVRYVARYTEIVRRKGGDANIGPRLPGLVANAGFANIRAGLASEREAMDVASALYAFARTPGTVVGMPRIFEVWATA